MVAGMVDSAKRSLRLAALIVVAGLVAAGCASGQAETAEPAPTTTTSTTEPTQPSSTEAVAALPNEQFCSSLVIAIEDSDQAFDREPGEDTDADRQLVALLRDLSAVRPDGAPGLLSELLESAASGAELSVRFADGEDIATIAADAEAGLERIRATDWDPAEDWVEEACGIDVLGIQLMMRDDDRVASAVGFDQNTPSGRSQASSWDSP